MHNKIHILFLVGIILLGAAFRFIALNFGSPYITAGDERTIVGSAYEVSQGDLRLKRYAYPGTTLIYPLGFLYRAFFPMYNAVTGSQATTEQYFKDRKILFHILVRFVVALIGTLTIILLYRIGILLFSKQVALVASLLLAVNELHMEHSHYATPDVMLTFFLLLTMLCSLLYLQKENEKFLYVGSIFIGLATATKYPGLIGISIIVIAFLMQKVREVRSKISLRKILRMFIFSKTLWICGTIIIVVFSITTPYFWVDLQDPVIKNLRHEARSFHATSGGHSGLSYLERLWYYLQGALGLHVPGILALFGWAGFLLLLFKRKSTYYLITAFYLVFLLSISFLKLNWDRWVLPLIPLLLLFAAAAMVEGYRYVSRWGQRRSIFLRVALHSAVWLLFLMMFSFSVVRATRTEMYLVCRGHVNYYDRRTEITNENIKRLECPMIDKAREEVHPRRWQPQKYEAFLHWLGVPLDSYSFGSGGRGWYNSLFYKFEGAEN